MPEIIRPTLLIEKKICLRNIERMARKAKNLNVRLRPHFKTHQSVTIGNWFRDYGVKAITVSSVKMAEYFARDGWNDITIAFPVNVLEIGLINRLAAAVNLNLLIENREASQVLVNNMTVPAGVYLKIDTGSNRTGIDASKTGHIDALLKILAENKNIIFRGFLTHNGHTYSAGSIHEIFSRHYNSLLKLQALKQKYGQKYPDIEISTGDTPSCALCSNFSGVDEIRPGNFVFFDLMQLSLGTCHFEDIALRVACPVVAKHSSRNEVVIYGGAVHLSLESLINRNGKRFFGRIVIAGEGGKQLLDEHNYVARLSQEHGIMKVSRKNFALIGIGDLVEIIPVHSCLTANLAKQYFTEEGEKIAMMSD